MMRPRKPHAKSKFGCTTCKRRRVKCDEARPSCQSCQKRGITCEYSCIDPLHRLPAFSRVLVFERCSIERPEEPSNGVKSLGTNPKEDVEDELEPLQSTAFDSQLMPLGRPSPPSLVDALEQNGPFQSLPNKMQPRMKHALHHFVTVIGPSFTPMGGRKAANVWASAIMSLSASYGFVLEGIISATSLHLSRTVASESEKRAYSYLALSRVNRGLIEYRKEVAKTTDKNAEALFSFHHSLSAYVFITSGDECKALFAGLRDGTSKLTRLEITQNAVHANTRILRCLRGGLFAVVSHWHHLSQGRWSALVKQDWDSIIFPATPTAIEEDKRLHALEKMWQHPGREYQYHFGELRRALGDLRECYALCSQLDGREDMIKEERASQFLKRVMTWIFKISQEFITLLDQQVPEAWVLLAHYANLLVRIRPVWWLADLPPNIISTTALILNQSQWHLIQWPARAVEADLVSLREGSPAPSRLIEHQPNG